MPRNPKNDLKIIEGPEDKQEFDAELDRALKDSFPASDPVSLASPTKAGKPNHKQPLDTSKPARRRARNAR